MPDPSPQLTQTFECERFPRADAVRIHATASVDGYQIRFGPIALKVQDYDRIGEQRVVAALAAELFRLPPDAADAAIRMGAQEPLVYVDVIDGVKVALPRFQERGAADA